MNDEKEQINKTHEVVYAFACASENGHQAGMSIRDYFAATALNGILAKSFGENMVKDACYKAYEYADAMLAERSRL
jgi:hypothetical protein